MRVFWLYFLAALGGIAVVALGCLVGYALWYVLVA